MGALKDQAWRLPGRERHAHSAAVARDAQARQLFDRSRLQAQWRRLWSAVRGAPATLIERDDLLRGATPVGQRASGVQQVALAQIVGSEGRAHEFDRLFGPNREHTRARWQSVAVAWMDGVTLPPVRLVQVGDRYLVRDGHHRISVARAFGANSIDAVVEQRFAAPLAGPLTCPGQPADAAAIAVDMPAFGHRQARHL